MIPTCAHCKFESKYHANQDHPFVSACINFIVKYTCDCGGCHCFYCVEKNRAQRAFSDLVHGHK